MGILRTDKISGLETPTAVTGSVVFDGTGDYLSLSSSTDFNYAAGDFTIEGWIYMNSLPSSGNRYTLASKWTGGGDYSWICNIFNDSGNMELNFSYTTNGSTATDLFSNGGPSEAEKWYHIAYVRDGSTLRQFVNGVQLSTNAISGTIHVDTQDVSIGRHGQDTNYMNGYISNLRILKGTALYTSDFTVPTHELEVISDTVLLCCNNSDSAAAASYAGIGTSKTITVNGDAAASTFSPGITRDFTFGTEFKGVTTFDTQGYFVPPSGTTTERFPDFVAVPDSSARGVSVGGLTDDSTNVIEYITISTTGNSQDFGDLQQKRSLVSGASSNVRGIVVGGYISPGSNTNTIEYTTIASTGNAQYFGELNLTSNAAQSCSNSTRAVFNKGQTRSLGYVTIATLGNSIDFGTLVNANGNQPGALSNTTRGIWGGGTSPANVNAIDFVTIATTGDAVNFGDLTEVKHGLKGFSSSTRGVWGGGDLSPAFSNVIEYITIASLGNSQNFGDLTIARRNTGATSSKTRGIWMGADYSPTNLNVIDYVTIATTGDAVDFGDLITAKGGGAFSNAHGGLG
jgi:hypothetical protein